MTGAKTKQQVLDAEPSGLGRTPIAEICATLRTIAVCAVVAFLAYEFKESIVALAGKSTAANILVSMIADYKVTLGWMVGGAGGLLAYRERKLRHDTTARMTNRIQQLEKAKNPSRTSSKLTNKGQTNPGDVR